ncbi:otoraplin [Aquarana catesbeiana]|uniref:Otoraplin n=2 Tax=Aquarana catesbeiana TaxID=8400 RepID=OTOR_AQUCT|nr:RecName: Full=Otoraplin; Flags: Precursor [Aquarana catesbeiana]AAF82728.1 otoraplin [Aquarana catesbeiana]
MAKTFYVVVIVLCLGFIHQKAYGVYMQKLSDKKLCADDECIYAISFGRAEDDYNAPDCRFVNLKKGELVYIYTKLVKENDDAGEFWSGSVYSDQYRDQQGLVGYFPSSLVTELTVYKDELQELPTTAVDFYCD